MTAGGSGSGQARAADAASRIARDPPGGFALTLTLGALTGWVDAVGMLRAHAGYPSFMSGNSTLLAVATVTLDMGHAAALAGLIGAFLAGIVGGELLRGALGPRGEPAFIAIEAVLLAVAAASAGANAAPIATLLVLAAAMGLQNAVARQVGGVPVSLVAITGTLIQAARAFVDALRGISSIRAAAPYLALWLAVLSGAGAGTLAVLHGPPGAIDLACPAVVAALAAAWLSVASRRRPIAGR
ncbi:YoaK family protein [Salinarimonas soli]|uniref:DUF1275 domain-containing protein n=1 Tax=Salinarimonas soli TaxID=1638099 RepID=A0A5B2VBV3_9HYPH|nr:YoaK family protein [Salinarimonas soli]KAA2236591.1 DUF1275 domain-containing protein [Salinarimonas soli]